jgi:hypothetical protein
MGLTVSSGDKVTSETDIQTTYSNSTAVSNQVVTTAQVTLNDFDNTTLGNNGPACKVCHNPLSDRPSANIYLDKYFGGFMFQDPGAPGPPSSRTQLQANVAEILFSQYTRQEEGGQRFSDVPAGSPAQVAIGLLARTHIMNGFPNGSFQPNVALTRAELATVLANILKLPLHTANSVYSDVLRQDAFAPAVWAAVKAGVMVTPAPNKFGPSDPVSRQEFATSLARAFRLTKSATINFRDDRDIAPWASTGIRAVVAAGYLTSFPDGTFRPTAPVTRSEAAQVFLAALRERHQNTTSH